MQYTNREIKPGVKVHYINTEIFKTNLVTIFLTVPLDKKTVTKNTLIPAVLRRGSKNLKTQEQINKKLEEMYGADFDCSVEKLGDNQLIKLYIEFINDKYIQETENISKQAIETILDIAFNPLLENNMFLDKFVQTEKENIKQLINAKIDDKDKYSQDRCIEEMYKDKPYGIYKYGYVEDVDKITAKDLYEQYINFINNSKIDIFVSGEIEKQKIDDILDNNENIKKLKPREEKYILNTEETEKKDDIKNIHEIKENLNVTQGKLIICLDVKEYEKGSRYAVSIYNAILGGGSNSKLFQNVREKASLAYSVGSLYLRQKNNIMIKAGIEIPNYQKAVEIIKQQIEDMKNGNFNDEDIENAKKFMIYGIKSIQDEQDTAIIYYIAQELEKSNVTPEEYMEKIQQIQKEDIIKIAKKVQINTIYFLQNDDEGEI